ncbi:MAG: ATP-binding protein [Bacteroidales bacterium]
MIQRKIFEELKSHLKSKEYSILTGARQTGKTTLLRQLEEFCKQEHLPYVFLNLENKNILSELDQTPLNILKFLPETDKRIFVFVDEVQYLEDASNFLKLLYDEHSQKIKIVATGSSAFYIDDSFRDSLAGRKKLFHLYTCSFNEYLYLSGNQELLEEKNRIEKVDDSKSILIGYLKNAWETYMVYGGYPAIITEPDKQEKVNRLKEIRDSFLKRDMLESGVNNEIAFYNLIRIIAGQCGSLINVNELASTLRIRRETVVNYLTILQKCFHIAMVRPFYKNLRKELVKMPKVFMLDNGLRNCLVNNFNLLYTRTDRGELWENTVFRILADVLGSDEIRYWRTIGGNEVDFVLPDINNSFAVEAKFDKNQIKKKKFKIFENTYPNITLQFAWMNPFDENFFRRLSII